MKEFIEQVLFTIKINKSLGWLGENEKPHLIFYLPKECHHFDGTPNLDKIPFYCFLKDADCIKDDFCFGFSTNVDGNLQITKNTVKKFAKIKIKEICNSAGLSDIFYFGVEQSLDFFNIEFLSTPVSTRYGRLPLFRKKS